MKFLSFYSLGDPDSETEAALLGEETPLTVIQLANDTFIQQCEINTNKYFQEVRKLLYQMGNDEATRQHASFFRGRMMSGDTFHSDKSDPKFDAWCLVLNSCRPNFNSKALFKKYPTVQEQIRYLQNKMEI